MPLGVLLKLKAHAGRNDNVELAPSPRLYLEWPHLGRDGPILSIKGVEIGNGDAETRVPRPFLVVVFDEVERDGAPPYGSHRFALPGDFKAHMGRVECERLLK